MYGKLCFVGRFEPKGLLNTLIITVSYATTQWPTTVYKLRTHFMWASFCDCPQLSTSIHALASEDVMVYPLECVCEDALTCVCVFVCVCVCVCVCVFQMVRCMTLMW